MLLDIGLGIVSAILVGELYSLDITPLLIGLGIAFALLPDIDFIYSVARHWRNNESSNERAIIKHRDLVHYPLIYLPLGGLIALSFGPAYSLLFLFASLGHFIHDSIGIGWGIPWLWPFTERNYTFFYRYTAPEKKLPSQMLYRWEREHIDTLIDEYNDTNWLENIYFKLHPVFLTEILFFVATLFILWHIKV